MLDRRRNISRVSVSVPSQPGFHILSTAPNTTTVNPLLNDRLNELDLTAEIVSSWNSLEHRVDIWVCARTGAHAWLGHEVEEGLGGVGEVGALGEGGWTDGTLLDQVVGCLEWKVVEVAPCAVGGNDDLGVVWEVELGYALVIWLRKNRMNMLTWYDPLEKPQTPTSPKR